MDNTTKDQSGNSSLKWMVLLTVIVGTFLGRLDQTVVNLAIPKMIDDFGITVSAASWIVTAYIIANAVFVPVWGKLGDTIGRKKIYIMGFSVFIVGSILAGLAWNLSSMIVFRVIQAVASSADYPTAMAILAITFKTPRERAQALGIWSSSFASAAVFGPLIGGPLIDTFGWRSVFLINLPVGLLGLFMAMAYVHESVSDKKTVSFDWWGATTIGVALAFMVLILDQGMTWGWNSGTAWLCYAMIVVFSGLFYWIETRHPEPVVDFSFFKNRVFNAALLNNFIIFMGMMGSVFAIPIFAQTFLGYDATQSGLLFIPMGICIPISAGILGRLLLGKVPPRTVIFWGTLGAAVSFYFLTWIDPRSSAWDIIWPLALMALFMGSGMAQRTNLVAASVPPEEIGVASSILALVRNVGGAFGIAVFGTLINTFAETNVLDLAKNSVIHATTPAEHATAIALIELKAQVLAYSQVYLIAAGVVALGAFAILIIKKQPGGGAGRQLSHEETAMAEA
ncbi:MAG: multidrug efflux MFS transporter [Patescibacteria group bacterium]|nr:multidrug efflux MFS transporter [Patescibacteria group bacterium]MDE1967000.1 multidrug efflux MFS transporter [Patescibacteria group bacterium]